MGRRTAHRSPQRLCTPLRVRRLGLALLSFLCISLGFAAIPAFAAKKYVRSGSFGEPGSAPGQFSSLSGIAVNEVTLGLSGEVYVADVGNERVERFSADGKELKGEFNGAATPAKSFEDPGSIAVDNSANPLDPSAGDVYVSDWGHNVVDKFSPEGAYVGQIAGPGGARLEFAVHGVAVDAQGSVWLYDEKGRISEYSNAVSNTFLSATQSPIESDGFGLAVDSKDDLYVSTGSKLAKLDASGKLLIENMTPMGSSDSAVAVNTSDAVFIASQQEGAVALLDSTDTLVEHFGAEGPEGPLGVSLGIAVNSATGAFYVAQQNAASVAVFNAIVLPTVTTGQASGARETVAALHGDVNPEAEPLSQCHFEYATDEAFKETEGYSSSNECEPNAAELGTGSQPLPVSSSLSGLQPRTLYHFRLTAANANGSSLGADQTLYTIDTPTIEGESASAVSPSSATIGAQLNAAGLPTTYRAEYGTSLPYSSATPDANAGAALQAAGVQIHLSGLQPNALYHARIVAQNELGSVSGGDFTFTTPPAAGPQPSTPDNRTYEAVSLPAHVGSDGDVYHPTTGHEGTKTLQTATNYPVRAAANGDAVAYAAEPPAGEGSGAIGAGGGNVFLATRGPGGWKPADVTPPIQGSRGIYAGFSSDLSLSFLAERDLALTPDAPPPPCSVLYSRDTTSAGYRALLTATETLGPCHTPVFAGTSADGSATVFESQARLTPEATEGQPGETPAQGATFNLYDSAHGALALVNVLPPAHPGEPGEPVVNAAVGGVSTPGDGEGTRPPGYHHFGDAISADGSRIVWTDLNTGTLYVREDPAGPNPYTVPVAAGAYYRGASSDGSKIFFTDTSRLTPDSTAGPGAPDLYQCQLVPREAKFVCSLSDLSVDPNAGEQANVLGMLGNSDDGSRVYFVATGVLARGENARGEKPEAGQPNLYGLLGGETRFIATLGPEDNAMAGTGILTNEGPVYGDWRAGLTTRTAEVTPDGSRVLFVSRRNLTGYDNSGGCQLPSGEPAGCPEVFTYDAAARVVSCASCDPTGAPPGAALVGELVGQARLFGGAYLMTPGFGVEGPVPGASYQLRSISANGGRVFFQSKERLTPQATVGVDGVYEWEREGEGGCTADRSSRVNRGCVFLISGVSGEDAVFIDADLTGDNVFFTTRAQLAPEDHDEQVDVYDAHLCTSESPCVAKLTTSCTDAGCQGAPPAPSTFATPSSVTFAGAGNFPPPPPQTVIRKTSTRAQLLARALKACRAERRHRRRARCEAAARKRYGPARKNARRVAGHRRTSR
jgi:streptogramin lyase